MPNQEPPNQEQIRNHLLDLAASPETEKRVEERCRQNGFSVPRAESEAAIDHAIRATLIRSNVMTLHAAGKSFHAALERALSTADGGGFRPATLENFLLACIVPGTAAERSALWNHNWETWVHRRLDSREFSAIRFIDPDQVLQPSYRMLTRWLAKSPAPDRSVDIVVRWRLDRQLRTLRKRAKGVPRDDPTLEDDYQGQAEAYDLLDLIGSDAFLEDARRVGENLASPVKRSACPMPGRCRSSREAALALVISLVATVTPDDTDWRLPPIDEPENPRALARHIRLCLQFVDSDYFGIPGKHADVRQRQRLHRAQGCVAWSLFEAASRDIPLPQGDLLTPSERSSSLGSFALLAARLVTWWGASVLDRHDPAWIAASAVLGTDSRHLHAEVTAATERY